MMFTMSKAEFTQVHNAMCEIRSIQAHLNGVVNDTLVERFVNALEAFETGFAGVRTQESAVFDSKYNMCKAYGKYKQFKSIWSMYDEVDSFEDAHAFPNAKYVSNNGRKAAIEGNTWGDLWAAADKVISRNSDHIFIEYFYTGDDNETLSIGLGS